jgi:hypothetical protein
LIVPVTIFVWVVVTIVRESLRQELGFHETAVGLRARLCVFRIVPVGETRPPEPLDPNVPGGAKPHDSDTISGEMVAQTGQAHANNSQESGTCAW